MKLLKLVVLAPILLASSALWSQSTDADSAKNFAQHFYDWYVPMALADLKVSAAELALSSRPSDFSKELRTALNNDFAAQAKSSDYIVGIDYDPFLDAQDPCEQYVVENVGVNGKMFLADIRGICSGKKDDSIKVVAELEHNNGHWQFVNFLYPNVERVYPHRGDLLSLLAKLQELRSQRAH